MMISLLQILTILILTPIITSTPWLRKEPSIEYSSHESKSRKIRALEDYLLPKTIKPETYDIQLLPFLNEPINLPESMKFTVEGTVEILCLILQATDTIVMHAFDMEVFQDSIQVLNLIQPASSFGVLSMTMSEESDKKQFLTIKLNDTLVKDLKYSIKMNFKSKVNNGLEGFYRSSYTDNRGNVRWLGVTQFQPAAARRAFPCFDEPEWKAKFTIHIAHSPQYKVLSNMPDSNEDTPVNNESPYTRDWIWTHFTQSVPMSTYLVAFSVNQFDSIINVKDPRFKLWARPEAVHQGRYSNDVSPKIVQYLTEFTNQQYALPKVDQIAIPDFSAGAMENWGLITYRETALLFEDGVSTSANRQRVETVVTHELAHQWFGNLVTLKWWDTIWMNEGFATYFEYHALAQFQDTWQMERQFVLDKMHAVLQSDALASTHAMQVPNVETPEDANAVFDNIAYSKGGCIVRFLIKHMGEEIFKSGIKDYINKKLFGNVVMKDLWESLALVVPIAFLPRGKTLENVMDTWTRIAGYPVVTLTRNYTTKIVTVSQKRFMTLPDPTIPQNESWIIPITYTTQANPNFDSTIVQMWLVPEMSEHRTTIDATDSQWIIFNNKQIGYYRVNYDLQNWQLLSKALGNIRTMNKIDVINRAQIMDDALALARAKMLDYVTALDTTEYLINETEYMPIAAALSALSYLNDRLTYEKESRQLFEWFMLSKLDNIYHLVNGFSVTEDDSHIMRLKRTLVLSWVCSQGHEECNNEANKLFQEWKLQADPDKNNPIAPDLKSVVYCSGMKRGGEEEYDFLFERYESASNVASEQAIIIAALGCASNTTLLQRYLDESIKENSKIRQQDARSVITAVYFNPIGVDIALDFILLNWNRTAQIYESIGSTGRVITGLAAKLNAQEHKNKLSTFLNENNDTLSAQQRIAINSAINTVDIAISWHTDHSETVLNYLEMKQDPTATPRPTTTPNPGSTKTPKPTDDSAVMSFISPLLLCITTFTNLVNL